MILKTVIAVAGTPGPLLGNGTSTTCTVLAGSPPTESDSLSLNTSVLNSATRKHYTVARATIVRHGTNTDEVYVLPAEMAANDARRVANYEELTPLGFGDRNDIDLGSLDVGADVGGESVIVWAEVR